MRSRRSAASNSPDVTDILVGANEMADKNYLFYGDMCIPTKKITHSELKKLFL